jgi:predicted dehydrogenase
MQQGPEKASPKSTTASRRDLLKTTAAVGAVAATMAIPSFVHAAESNTLKVGLVGCGGRGSGAAKNALTGDEHAELYAMGDMFPDKLEAGLKGIQHSEVGKRVNVTPDRQFTGWDAYKGVIETCDVVLLATPPFFRHIHLAAAIDAGKHVFCEKPVATDVPALKSVMDTAAKAKAKNLSLVSGLCYRYDRTKIEIVKRIHDGAVGNIMNLQGMYYTNYLWTNPRQPGWSDMEWQLRNWLYFTWLSGDMIVEQHIHTIDKLMWIMKDEPPVSAQATGGRACRTEPQWGNIYDHFATIFEWKDGVRAFAQARQWDNCATDISDWVYGTDGVANIMQHQITGKNPWKGKAGPNMYDLEHVALFKSIREGNPINNGDYMCKSTGAAIMGRMAAYTGTKMTWDLLMNSKESLAPKSLEMGPLPTPPIAVPGKTKYA